MVEAAGVELTAIIISNKFLDFGSLSVYLNFYLKPARGKFY